MKIVLIPSLEHIALVKIVTSLWNQHDVRDLIIKHSSSSYFSSKDGKWKEIEERVIEKVPLLPLPQLLKGKLLSLIEPIGLQISKWKEYNHKHFHINLPAELCFTPQGTIDRMRTAKMLVINENLDIFTRYKIACIYCLEDDILKFWNNMPEDLKECVSFKFPIIHFWTRNMKKRELWNAHIDYKEQFHMSVFWNNQVAVEYFLQKLTEKEESLEKAAKNVTDDDILYFLITEMNEKQQIEVVKNNPVRVLKYLLEWPFQSLFIGVANYMWDFLSKVDYLNLLLQIVHKIEKGYNDWNYQELFKEFWQRSPNDKKTLFVDEINKGLQLPSLFSVIDKESARLILKDATLEAKDKLIYYLTMNTFYKVSIHDNEWNNLRFFIHECLPTKNAVLKFKEEVEKRMYFKESTSFKKRQWNQLFSFSDGSICKYGKRSVEGGEGTSTKQFRSLQ